jgi:hypothetical protein
MAGKFRYLPLLRSKTGEANALQTLSVQEKARLFPIINLVLKPPAGFADSVAASWMGLPLALDGTFHVDLTGASMQYIHIYDRLGKGKVPVIPCVEFGADPAYLAVVQKARGRYANGLVLKAKLNELASLASWISTQGWTAAEIDLVIDLKEVSGFDPSLLAQVVTTALTDKISATPLWRTVTLAASAAPKDHGGLTTGRNEVPRRDWLTWVAVSGSAPFALHYGDYASAHPDLTDPPGVAMTRATVSVRYTLDDRWIVLKGRPTRGKTGQPMDKQYRMHAKTLASDPNFGGLSNCWGDLRVGQIALGSGGAGNRTTWASIAASRHLSLVANRLP